MKRSLVLKALTMMDQERVNNFIDNDCRSIDEIVDAVADELEKSYIYFMVDLYEKVNELEKEDNKNLVKYFTSDLSSSPLIKLSEEERKRLMDTMKDFKPAINLSIPKIDFSNLVIKRGD
jgi:hypothetical protein